jgi:hypothetical protein
MLGNERVLYRFHGDFSKVAEVSEICLYPWKTLFTSSPYHKHLYMFGYPRGIIKNFILDDVLLRESSNYVRFQQS